MFKSVLKTVFGDPHQKEIKTLTPLVEEVNALADEMKSKSDEELRGMMAKFRQELTEATAEQRVEVENLRQQVVEAVRHEVTAS